MSIILNFCSRGSKEILAWAYGAHAISRSNPIKSHFNKVIVRIFESGIYNYWIELYVAKHQVGDGKRPKTFKKALTIREVGPMLLILSFGLVPSALVFVVELIRKNI